MSKEDDAIIQAASRRLYDHVTLGGDTFACALSDTAYVSNMSETPADCQRMVRQMCDRAAAEVIRSYLGSLEAAGWAVMQRLPDDAITHNTFPKQGRFLGRRVRVAFNYDTANAVLGTVRREDDEAPGRMIIELDDGRLVLSTECQYSLVKESGTRQ
ncbi:hypothetical protein ABNQ39_20445 [Azospirillum sp. A26]|uniref:hypothetical protein n=1 Tax=Azospirillum sp. A26 TaxID=3160607 RepID=UPI00366ED8EE